jgi:streptogramin lyase
MRPPWLKDEEDVLTPADREAYAKLGVGTWGGINQVPGRQAPRRLNYDPKNDVVWVASNHGNNIVSINAKTRVPTYYKVPLAAHPYRVDVDKDGNAYTSMLIDDVVLKLNPATKQWTTYRLPTNGCELRSIYVDRRKTEVWLPCDRAARVIRMQFRTPEQIQALKGAAR